MVIAVIDLLEICTIS